MLLLLPCAGESSRFPGLRPKWMLTQPNGNLMVCDAITKLNLENIKKIVVIALKEHVHDYKNSVKEAFDKLNLSVDVEIFVLEEKTKSQPETVAKYLSTLKNDEAFFIKDCDGQFECKPEPKNEIVTADVSLIKGTNVTSKSFCKFNENGHITTIVEKQVVSRHFCVGGYSFASSEKFLNSYSQISHHENLYVSHVIDHMLLNDETFANKTCNFYEDWGTLEDWLTYKSTFVTLFVDVDGVLFKNSSEFMHPKWGETSPLSDNVNYIKDLKSSGRVQLILTTARSKKFASITEKQLHDAGIQYDQILYDMLHAKRIIINDHAKSNPPPACQSFSVQRDEDNLRNLGILN